MGSAGTVKYGPIRPSKANYLSTGILGHCSAGPCQSRDSGGGAAQRDEFQIGDAL
jgi:hypothetical protein